MRIGTARRSILCGSALALAIPTLAYAQAAEEEAQPAADAPDDQGSGNEIIVTATKREQTLQDVPIAVSVTTAATLERAQIRDIKDLSTVVPSLRVVEHQNSAQTDFLIRGFGNGANNAGIEPSVGVFIDGVYRSRSAAQIGDFPDVQRIEVLRGPQSTLFGKNASVGVISIVTQEPKFQFGGNLEATYGNYNALVLKGVVTGPITDTLAASIAAGYNRRDGYVKDLATGGELNERNRWFVRGQLLFKPNDQLKIRIIGDYSKIDENCCAVVNVRAAGPTAIIQALGGRVNSPANPFGDVVYFNFDTSNRIENYGVSGQIDYDLGPAKLTSITAWRKMNALTQEDSDFTSANILQRHDEAQDISTFTQELRLTANFADRVNVLIGGYYFHENIKQNNILQWGNQARPYFNALVQALGGGALSIGTGNSSDLELIFGGLDAAAAGNPALATRYVGQFYATGQGLNEQYRLNNEAVSAFGQVDVKITDRLTLTGGINYTHDRKNFTENVVSTDTFAGVNFNAPQYAVLRNQLLVAGFLKAAGIDPTNTAAVTAFATNPATAPIYGVFTSTAACLASNPNNPAVPCTNPLGLPTFGNPLNGLRALQVFPPYLNVPNAVEPGRTSDSNVSYTARLAFDATDNINVYLSYATGFKASSINLSRDARPTPADLLRVQAAGLAVTNLTSGSRFALPEKSTVYEMGIKANWGVASANLAVFKQIVRDFQSNIFTGLGFFLGNAGKQSTFGIEFEGVVHPTRELTFGLSMTYLDPKYDSYVASPFGDASGVRPAGIPSISATFTGEWNKELANSDHLILRGDFHYESPVQILDGLPGFITKDPVTGAILPAPGGYAAGLAAARQFRREVNDLNASITYAMHNGLELTVWGRNLLNDRYLVTIFDSPAQPGSVSAYLNQPLTWGGTVRFRW